MYAERRAQHSCNANALDLHAPGFDFIQSMLSFDEHPGFSLEDLASLLFRCQRCQRIFHIHTDNGDFNLDELVEESAVHICAADSD